MLFSSVPAGLVSSFYGVAVAAVFGRAVEALHFGIGHDAGSYFAIGAPSATERDFNNQTHVVGHFNESVFVFESGILAKICSTRES